MNETANNGELKQSVIAAFLNIKNCYSIGLFTEKSLANFKKSKYALYSCINKESDEEVESVQEWFQLLLTIAVKLDDKEVNSTAREVAKACSKKDRKLYESLYPSTPDNNSKTNEKLSKSNKEDEIEGVEKENEIQEFDNETEGEESNVKSDFTIYRTNTNSNTNINSNTNRLNTNADPMLQKMMEIFRDLAISQTTTRRLRLDSLKNSNQDVQEWFNKFERQTAKWPYEEKGYEVAAWFEETALKYWEMMQDQNKYDYNKIKELLLKKFRAVDCVFEAKTKFYSMKQELNENVEDFVYRIHKCKNDWPKQEHNIYDRDVIKIFKKGLKPELAKQFVSNEADNLQELIQQARRLENILKKETESRLDEAAISVEAAISNNGPIRCYKCGQSGHLANKCTRVNRQEKTNEDFRIICMFCGKNNHFAVNCRIMKSEQTKFYSKSENKEKGHDKKKQFCRNCKMSNHSTEKCRNRDKSKIKCFRCEKEGHRAKDCKEELNE